ncbi:glycerate kinase [Ferrovum sp.]|uniref:glycerate kinase type-2 family protein n=1 Tax=Ferrovum sp. TaxID=2609467 RepID=UPI002607A884|nr:glycerate kinase [Ferrovum sp.]
MKNNTTPSFANERVFLRSLFESAVTAADPHRVLPSFLPAVPRGRTVVVGAGKAAGAMAQALEQHWMGALEGVVVTRYGHKVPTRFIEVLEAAHPVPDEAGQRASQRILEAVQGLTADDLVICLISGGGSALLAAPAPGLTLADKQTMNRSLLRSGATITEMNCVRKHLSSLKGGRLALACYPAQVVTLLISDVPGDDPTVIASGPTVADPTTFAEACAIVEKYGLQDQARAYAHLCAAREETPKPGDLRLTRTSTHLIATPQHSLEAAAAVARAAGVTPVILGDSIEGEAREVAKVMAGIAHQVRRHGQPAARPCVLLSGGETTVTVRGKGRGGRNVEFLLALTLALRGEPGVFALAGDTDGIDGTEDNAGAVVLPDTWARAEHLGLKVADHLADNDGYGFFSALGDLVITGPTLTNVNDFRALLIR